MYPPEKKIRKNIISQGFVQDSGFGFQTKKKRFFLLKIIKKNVTEVVPIILLEKFFNVFFHFDILNIIVKSKVLYLFFDASKDINSRMKEHHL